MVELLEETRANTEYIRSKGYRVVEMWECEWPQMKRTNRELQRFIATEVRRTLDTIKIMSLEGILSEVRNERLFGWKWILDSVSIDNEYDYENEILPLTIMRMRFAQNTCSTRSGNSFHDEISSKTRSARNEFLKGKVYLL